MQATTGDRICIHGNIVGHPDKNGEIVEVHGTKGEPPYLVKFDDGHTRLVARRHGPWHHGPSPRIVLRIQVLRIHAPAAAEGAHAAL
jgi:hypothetical protein